MRLNIFYKLIEQVFKKPFCEIIDKLNESAEAESVVYTRLTVSNCGTTKMHLRTPVTASTRIYRYL